VVAGFQVSINGRFWLSAEARGKFKPDPTWQAGLNASQVDGQSRQQER
jgi:hypothetical protein